MTDELTIHQVSSELRTEAIRQIRQDLHGRVLDVPLGKHETYLYYYRSRLACYAALKALRTHYGRDLREEAPDGGYLMIALIDQDMRKANHQACLAAWLTWDGWRWHHENPEVPEDLSYGLVLSYPIPVLSLARVLLARDLLDVPEDFTKQELDESREFARDISNRFALSNPDEA